MALHLDKNASILQKHAAMATTAPRSASDATRFTATTPHASSKIAGRCGPNNRVPFASTSARFAAPVTSRFSPPVSAAARGRPGRGPGGGSGGDAGGPRFEGETLDQKVARLRAAHLRAKASSYSRFDRIVEAGRRFCDAAHRVTVYGLISFSVLGAIVTGYTIYDMIIFNRKRKAEFFAMHRRLEAESVEAARLALMQGTATQEQIDLIDDENERLANAGKKKRWFERTGLVSAPKPSDARPPHVLREELAQAAAAAAQKEEDKKEAAAATARKEDRWVWFRSRPTADKQSSKAGTGRSGGLADVSDKNNGGP